VSNEEEDTCTVWRVVVTHSLLLPEQTPPSRIVLHLKRTRVGAVPGAGNINLPRPHD
jgi:hypothetical protein